MSCVQLNNTRQPVSKETNKNKWHLLQHTGEAEQEQVSFGAMW